MLSFFVLWGKNMKREKKKRGKMLKTKGKKENRKES
jgi:hypothetical protein